MRNKILMGILLLVAMVPKIIFSQVAYWGEAGTNVPENLTTQIIQAIEQKTVGSYILRFRQDKYSEDTKDANGNITSYGVDKAPDVDINNIIRLRDTLMAHGKDFELIYTFDTRGRCSIADAFYAYDKFITAGVHIPAVEYGNEEYAKVAGHSNFNQYAGLLPPIDAALILRGFTGWKIYPLAKIGDLEWNPQVASYCSGDGEKIGAIHFYWNKDEASIMGTLTGPDKDMLPVGVSTQSGYLSVQDSFYHNLYVQVTQGDLIPRSMSWYEANFPGKPVAITEFGPAADVGNLQGALGYQATEDWFYNVIKHYNVFAVCKFNGPGTPTGSMTKKGKYDPADITSAFVKRLSYYTQAQFFRNMNAVPVPSLVTHAGSYNFSYHNMSRAAMDNEGIIPLAQGLYISSMEYECITSDDYYKSCGTMSWWGTGSQKSYDISGSMYFDHIPALSFGYLHVTVAEIVVPGCTSSDALNYDPAANHDDGSCYYQRDCRCQDPVATNADMSAPCADNSLCTYPAPTVCYKQRIIFKFLGCKPDPKCIYNNCKPN